MRPLLQRVGPLHPGKMADIAPPCLLAQKARRHRVSRPVSGGGGGGGTNAFLTFLAFLKVSRPASVCSQDAFAKNQSAVCSKRRLVSLQQVVDEFTAVFTIDALPM